MRTPKLRKACFNTIPHATHVIALGAGPSLKSNIPAILKWRKKHNAMMIVSNYNQGVNADYTTFVDTNIFSENIAKANGIIVLTPEIPEKYWPPYVKDRVMILQVGKRRDTEKKYRPIVMKKKGMFNFHPRSAGYAAILMSVFFRPNHLLIAGFDGRNICKSEPDHKYRYLNGKTKRIKIPRNKRWVNRDLIKQFTNVLLPYIRSESIQVHAFANDRLSGLKPKSLNIRIKKIIICIYFKLLM